ncbi:MAG: hypothetical protein EON91_12410 [Brevundimonas sp.]|uniref:hypothetical protein n=1 Tax=Brevundimonas sp. TaxID=1871086 RepID=UPI0011F6D827|nr:hypothetical protein [Brevundimonas sp.]RZJ16630.1 MAG: hypothetical protein EON91_12410 [Brevundimonas sp.]
MFRTLGAVVASLLIAVAVAPSAHAFVDDEVVGLPGMRDNKEPPVGIPFVLPEGVELVEPILSYSFFDENDCKDPEEEGPTQELGNPAGAVQLCLVFNNKTGGPINIGFPPGVIVESESTETQNGILIQSADIEVPAKQVFVKLKFDCMNVTRGAPTGFSGARYRLGPVTQHPHIVEALRLLADRDLSSMNDGAAASAILADLYDGDPLTARHRAEIAELPAKQP